MNIVITGASSGIGYALAKGYAKPEVCLGLIARNPQKLAGIADVCRQQGANVEIGMLDVSQTETLTQWLVNFDRQHPVDLLIANAGVTSVMPDNGDNESWQAIQQVLNINILGVFNTVHPLISPMRQRQRGQIAIISSLAAYRGLAITPSYCASKAAVKAYGEALHGWLKQDQVHVSVVCPGFVRSELSAQFTAPKLFIVSAEKAARIIQRGLSQNKALIDFPLPLALGMKLLALMPATLAEKILLLSGYGVDGTNPSKPKL